MERGNADDREREALDLIRDIKKTGASPAIASKLDALARTLDLAKEADRVEKPQPRREFGAFAGKFSIDSAFFEPLSEDERRAWGED